MNEEKKERKGKEPKSKKKVALWQPSNLSNLDMFLIIYFAKCAVNDESPFL